VTKSRFPERMGFTSVSSVSFVLKTSLVLNQR
jgi:hypothetical protein